MDEEFVVDGRKVAPADATPSHDRPKISDLLPDFLDYLRVERNCTAGTRKRYEAHLRGLVNAMRDGPITELTQERLWLYKRQLMDTGISPATIAFKLSCVRTFLRYLHTVKGLTVCDPEKIRRPKVPMREVEYLTKDQVQCFLNAIPTHTLSGLRDRALVEVLCATGMRISEALSLDRDQINWEAGEAKIIGKGNKQRTVYFSPQAMAWVRRYLQRRADTHPALFVSQGERANRLAAQGTWRRFHRYAKRAGLRRVYPHMLRHTMATTLLANGCSIGHIRSLLGHEHLATTCRYYLGVISNAEVKAAHKKYLWYTAEPHQETHVNSPGQGNVEPWELDIASPSDTLDT